MESIHQVITEKLSDVMEIEETFDRHFSFYWRGRLTVDWDTAKRRILDIGKETGLYPFLSRDGDVVEIRFMFVKTGGVNSIKLNILLLIVTMITTLMAGTVQRGLNPFILKNLVHGLPFSISIMLILGGHELGHYFAAKKNGVLATLPYFIPAPHILGTFGAVIRMKSPIPSRKALIEIGAAGPIVGFILACFATVLGLHLSEIVLPAEGALKLGNPLIFSLIAKLIFPSVPQGKDILLHPVAFAGWIGFFITAINLLPVGQLDGGHVLFGLFPNAHRWMGYIIIGGLMVMGVFWTGWIFWGILLIVLTGVRHPPPMDSITPPGRIEKLIGIISFILFLITFTPRPFFI